MNATAEGLARVSSLFSLFGMTSAAHEHKRLKSGAPADAGSWTLFSTIRQAIPDFFNMFSDWKRVDDIKIDEQRNILYVLSSQVTNRGVELGAADIEVYDLGMLGNGFRKVATIDNADFCRQIQERTGIVLPPDRQHTFNQQRAFKITSMHPIHLNESISRHLQVTTENGLRILIAMGEEEADPAAAENSLKMVESNHLQFDLRHAQRPSIDWRIAGIHALPLDEEAIDKYARAPLPFNILIT